MHDGGPAAKIAVVYNAPRQPAAPDDADAIAEAESEVAARGVAETLAHLGYRTQVLSIDDDTAGAVRRLKRLAPDLVFNLCEAIMGDTSLEGAFCGLLELLRLPYTGAPPLALALCRDKPLTKLALAGAGIPTPRFTVVRPGEHFSGSLTYPLIVKLAREHGSASICADSVGYDATAVNRRIAYIHQHYGQDGLVEEYIEGREIKVTLLGYQDPEVLPIEELDLSALPPGVPRVVGYEVNWLESSPLYGLDRAVCPADLPPDLAERIRDIARRAYTLIGCRDYGRVDIRLKDNVPYVLEVNANPDIAPGTGITIAAQAAGLDYPALVGKVVELALGRTSAHPTS
ncbi:MAG: ATP-grasp domain-containing protein [Deinococcus sp.]|nr:ATP-grasp domain-containing protein [Deinococcus sp.]